MNKNRICSEVRMTAVDSQTESFHNLESTVAEIKQKCEKVCDTSLESDIKGKYYNQLWKNIDCQAMFKHAIFDRASPFCKPLSENLLPQFVKDEFTYQKKIQMKKLYADNFKGTYFNNMHSCEYFR